MNTPFWKRTDPAARLQSRGEAAGLLAVSLPEAQRRANFVVWMPEKLPGDLQVLSTTIRPEQPPGRPEGITAAELGQTPWSEGNPCSLRSVIGDGRRRLRLKQFLYDWAPPAGSVAPLWESPWFEGFACRDTVAWIGQDYRRATGACVQLDRTQIELSLVEGEFTHGEIEDILSSLCPADDEAAGPVRAAPFHELNYWVRYRFPPLAVPHGLWQYRHPHPYASGRILSRAEYGKLEAVRPLLPADGQFRFDSGFATDDQVETLLRHVERPSLSAWMRALRRDSPRAITLPPQPAEQSAEVRTARAIRGGEGWIACTRRAFGAWEAWWTAGDIQYAVWMSASPVWNEDWFLAFIDGLHA